MLDATTTSPSRVHAVSCVRDVVDDNTKKITGKNDDDDDACCTAARLTAGVNYR